MAAYRAYARWLIPLFLAILVIVFDQISKYRVVQALGPLPHVRTIAIIGDWFNLVYTHNTGVAFSLFNQMPQLLTVLGAGITIGVIYAYVTHLPSHEPLVQVGTGLVVGGALGNLIDRIRLGYVIDFVQVGWWPIFNIADMAISCGAAVLMFGLLRIERGERRQTHVTVQ